MEERKIIIHINRLGPITDSDIELKPFMVFSGESGVGKSYAALLVHYVYRILCDNGVIQSFFAKYIVEHNYFNDIVFEDEGKNVELFHFSFAEFEDWCNTVAVSYLGDMLGFSEFDADFQIHFCGMPPIQYSFVVKRNMVMMGEKEAYHYTLSLNGLAGIRSPHLPLIIGEPTFYEAVFQMALQHHYLINLERTILLPPSRGSLIGLSDITRSSILASVGMYREFLENLSDLKAAQKKEEHYSFLVKGLLNGEISNSEGDMFYSMDTFEIPITAAASSVKELAPFALMLQKGLLSEYAILFEEPESHLHPELQIKVADLLAFAHLVGSHIQITTHSDYLLRRLNDLIRLDELKTHLSEEEYLSFCQANLYNPEITLPSSAVAALYFEREGEAVKIRKQEVEDGIPFDTFKSAVNKQLLSSVKLSDKLEEIRGCGN